MSQENVEIIRRAMEAYNSHGVDGLIDFAHPGVTVYPFPEWVEEPIYRGKDGWKALLEEWTENFDDFKWETEQLIDAGEKVVALVRLQGHIKGTRVPVSQPVGAVFVGFYDDGTVAEARFFMTFREALEAAGMPVDNARG
jgi:ketosteroid isomerase-like protein